MDTQQPPRQFPDLQFRVLIIGRANAGKTTILQRVCKTTDSPSVYRGNRKVRPRPTFCIQRGEHEINDELVFSNHKGYVFHDSRGIEAGGIDELAILQDFIRRKSGEKLLRSRLHAIWYCVPMDNHRPGLDLKFYKDICPDNNGARCEPSSWPYLTHRFEVPVIPLFTKYDQYLFNVEMDVLDDPDKYDGRGVSEEAEKRFQEHYVGPLGKDVGYVRLEKMDTDDGCCDKLIETTAAALNENAVALMLLAVQRENLELSVRTALNRVYYHEEFKVKDIIWECLIPFPHLRVSVGRIARKIGSTLWIGVGNNWRRIFAGDRRKNCSSPEFALTCVELAYQKANVDMKIQQYLAESS
ncbi:hypothetical protein EI94DRAFT_1757371 [Lactarius quietus]|nr:hypothetical protein EI94DRAFT_1757371 [Lactarius quietus]